MPQGVPALKATLLAGAVGTYAGLWVWFFIDIWKATNGAPNLSSQAVYAVSVLGGILGTFFGVALGIQRKDGTRGADTNKLQLGRTLLQLDPEPKQRRLDSALATLAVWVYAVMGAFALLTILVHPGETPSSVSTMGAAFGTLVVALFAGAFAPGQTLQPQASANAETKKK